MNTGVGCIVQSVCALLLAWSFAYAGDRSEGVEQSWLKSLISIEVVKDTVTATPIGSGFVILSPNGHAVLVTAKHVIAREDDSLSSNLAYRINDRNGTSYLLTDEEVSTTAGEWFLSSSHDVALRILALRKDTDVTPVRIDRILKMDKLRPGAPVVIPGFPLGLRSAEHTDPIVRKGVVARIDPGRIILDAMIFGGNSGSPVIYSPTVKLGAGLNSPFINEEMLIGVISSSISFREEAVSKITGRTRVVFEDNTGLCKIVPADHIIELLNTEGFKRLDEALK